MVRGFDRFITSPYWLLAAALSFICIAAPRSGNAESASRQASPKSNAATSQRQPKQKAFSSPQDAASALYQAARNNDENAMLLVLGPGARDVVIWTDNPADRKADADLFAKKYEQMHRLVKELDDETTLYVGAENWPLPIPLTEKNAQWYFDTSLGRQEVLYRRIGENETNTIDVLRALTEAENEYYDTADSGSTPEYAPRFDSDQGKHDGLYWPTNGKEKTSPVGPYVAQASYNRSDRKPLHGYYLRMLMEQGPNAPGGARKYLVNGKMASGFAFVAFPAEYRSSSVKTFMVDQDGVVYEKDLGRSTVQLAVAIKAYNPDNTWIKTQ